MSATGRRGSSDVGGQNVKSARRWLSAVLGHRSSSRRALSQQGDKPEDSVSDASDFNELVPGANGVASTSFMSRGAGRSTIQRGMPREQWHTNLAPAARRLEQDRVTVPPGEALVTALERSRIQGLSRLPEGQLTGCAFECSLCLETVTAGQHVRRLGCLHTFHTRCIDQWIMTEQAGKRRRCPLCNADPVTGVIMTDRADSASRAAPEPSGITFGGVPIEQLLPRWALGSTGGRAGDEPRWPAPTQQNAQHDGIRSRGSSQLHQRRGLAALYA